MGWKRVCDTESILENDMQEFEIDGITILIARNAEGFWAYPPNCPHMEAQLAFGTCDGQLITCLQHLWQWDMRTGAPVGLAEEPLKQYRTKVEDSSVFVDLERELKYAGQDG